MNRFSADVDLLFSSAGDFVLDAARKDLADTKNLNSRALVQRIAAQVMSNPGDWTLQPTVGSGASGFAGRPNTAATGREIAGAIRASLLRADLLAPEELRVEVFPMSKDQIAIVLMVLPFGAQSPINIGFSFDFRDNKLVPRNY